MTIRTAVVVGNPRPRSRTFAAARHLAQELSGAEPELVVDLADLGASLLDWTDPAVGALVTEVADADLVVVASPTYKATYTGLLKLFLDRFSAGQLRGVAVPLMLGAARDHALAVDLALAPLLVHLGAAVPAGGLYVLDRQYDDPAAYADWIGAARPVLTALLDHARLQGEPA